MTSGIVKTAAEGKLSRTGPITGVVTLILVSDIEKFAAFYSLLGFEVGNYQPRTGERQWAWLYAPQASDGGVGPT